MSNGKQTVLVLVGISASGKSTFADNLMNENPNFVKVERDEIRKRLYGEDRMWKLSSKEEDVVTRTQEYEIGECLRNGFSPVISDTNLNDKVVNRFREMAERFGVEFEVNDSFLKVDVQECIRRDSLRTKPVGKDVIIRQAKKAGILKEERLNYEEYNKQNPNLPKVIVTDFDGTLTEKPHERSPYEWYKVGQDKPNKPVINILKSLSKDYKILVVSGRDSVCRQQSIDWITEHVGWTESVDYEIFMRPEKDFRKDSIVKMEIYENFIRGNFFVEMVFDDRSQVVKEVWRTLGLACSQVADGNF